MGIIVIKIKLIVLDKFVHVYMYIIHVCTIALYNVLNAACFRVGVVTCNSTGPFK